MPFIPREKIAAAREMDLLTYLRCFDPQELVHKGGNVYSTRAHDSLKISNGKWCWWSHNIGGKSALDYLTKVEGIPFLDAVQRILGELPTLPPLPDANATMPKSEFVLPPKHADNRRAFSYLRGRGIAPEIINHCIKSGQLYEDGQNHNCVFVGFEGEQARYAALRGTLSEKRFVGEVPGSDKRFSFAVPLKASSQTICVFECAIDALSYLTIIKMRGRDWRRANCLSLAGIYRPGKNGTFHIPAALMQYLRDNPNVRQIVLCLDSDEPGWTASAAIKAALTDYEVIDNPPAKGKDYNDLLQMQIQAMKCVKAQGGECR